MLYTILKHIYIYIHIFNFKSLIFLYTYMYERRAEELYYIEEDVKTLCKILNLESLQLPF